MTSEQITISCYENVPPFVESELEQLYENVGSSLVQYRAYEENFNDVHTYVARSTDRALAILLFRLKRGKVQVLNEVIRIDQEEIQRFADYIFSHFSDVNVISFKAIETDLTRLSVPCQRFNCLEDISMNLPGTPQEYLASLGKNTRRNIKRYMERLERSFPSYQFEIYEKDAVEVQYVRDIIDLNRARMAEKSKHSVIDEAETRHIADLARSSGLVGVLRIGGSIRAGAISYRVGANYFLNVLAHDPHYDEYWIGILCCYLTIRECILRGGKQFHFLWGRYDYKFALGARLRQLDKVVVYRSPLQKLLNADTALLTAYQGYTRKLKLWLKYGHGPVPKLAASTVKRFARVRRKVLRQPAPPGAAILTRAHEK